MWRPDRPVACCWILIVTGDARLRWITPSSSNKMDIISELKVQHTPGINQTVKKMWGTWCKRFLYKQADECYYVEYESRVQLFPSPYIQVVDIQLKAKKVAHSNKPLNTLSAITLYLTWLDSRKHGIKLVWQSVLYVANVVIEDVVQPIKRSLTHSFLITFIIIFCLLLTVILKVMLKRWIELIICYSACSTDFNYCYEIHYHE